MNSKVLIVGIIAFIVLGTFIYSGKKNNNTIVEGIQTQAQTSTQSQDGSQEGQSKSMGAVEVELTPVKLEAGQNMAFKLALNTHSVELSYDYTKIITASDDKGNEYKVLSWSGGESGHHLQGEIKMETLSNDADTITITIDGIDDQSANFNWEL